VTLTGIEDVVGGSGDDTLTGSAGTDNVFMGRDGNNDIRGNAGDHDTVSYGDALSGVTVDLSTGSATHGAATDTLTNITGVIGSNFNDTIVGSSLDDRLDGGLGTNVLTGNAGADSFVASKGGMAQITDFTAAQDNITLRDQDFGLGTSGTLAAANYAEDANAANAVNGTAHDYSGGAHNAGIVVINDGTGGADVWYTADLANASTANSQQIAHTNVDTSAIDNSAFHLAI
jgi:Ca2+-binding RTX toxin-like protein